MLIYENTKSEFIKDVDMEVLTEKIYDEFKEKIGRTSKNEIRSWDNSLFYMYRVLNDMEIPDNSGVAIEYVIPSTSKRVDFIISGYNEENENSAVIVELKQWEKAEEVIGKDGIIKTYLGGGIRETTHPSYQAWSYGVHIEDYNEAVQEENIKIKPCAYLHNYIKTNPDALTSDTYKDYLDKAPAFVKGEVDLLRDFIKKNIKYGDNRETIYKIENGIIKPSKSLQDALLNMLKGNKEFMMLDDQKIVYESAKELALKSFKDEKKRVLIVKGGPGTGKSVVAVNLLVDLTANDLVCQYVTKNAAPREIYSAKLSGSMKKSRITNLFKSSGAYTEVSNNEYDALIVDESHRLNEKLGMFKNLGENQIKEIIKGSKFSIFFIDESQRVHIDDYGSIDEIIRFSNELEAEYEIMELKSQFRCNGSDGYIAWLDDVLGIRKTANYDGFDFKYDIRVIDNPNDLRDMIFEKNEINNKSRMLAGYCWNWEKKTRDKSEVPDIIIDKYNFGMSWNLGNTSTWAIDKNSVNEVGCIHTSQGLEFDYVGVIVGKDLRYENGKVITDYTERAKTDRSLFGIKKMFKENPEKAEKLSDEIIRNTYRTLMSRGQKGCYIFFEDIPLREYFKSRLNKSEDYDIYDENLLAAEEKEKYNLK